MMYPSRDTVVPTVPSSTSINNMSQTSKASSRKRQRIHIMGLETASKPSSSEQPSFDDPPDWKHYTLLLSALLLTTTLALLSAWDAEQHCLQHETYALLDLVDDDNFQKAYNKAVLNEGEKCLQMFQYVLLPTGGVTAVFGGLALFKMIRHEKFFRYRATSPSPTCNVQLLTQVLFAICVLCGVHLYALASIMLGVRHTVSDNPYQSLAAVDQYGHVGDNANLYYMTWISVGIVLALLYQVSTAVVRWCRTAKLDATQSVLLPATSWHTGVNIKEDKEMWYKSLYQLRMRSGVWTAALFSCIVLIVSSLYVWNSVLWPYGNSYTFDDEEDDDNAERTIQFSSFSKKLTFNAYTRVCRAAQAEGLEPQLCRRTAAAWIFGVVAAILCTTAISMHLWARWSASKRDSQPYTNSQRSIQYDTSDGPLWERLLVQERLPLRTELALSIVLSIMLGLNAVWSTGVQGPAASVGNLYYASWSSFLLCGRICLGCMEEYYNIEEVEQHAEKSVASDYHQYTAPALDAPVTLMKDAVDKPALVDINDSKQSNTSTRTFYDPLEKDRRKRSRSYFFQFIFSIVCAASSYDAASNQRAKLTNLQRYMIWAPLGVSIVSLILFALCLSKQCYFYLSHFAVGGILAIAAFLVCLPNLVITMHSEDSWAVNGIGEIVTANLYYFSWASIITAGLLSMSYVKALLGIKKNDYMSVIWVGICKVCFVILGAGLHIWHTIADNCDFEEITSGAVTYCSRTVFAIIIALVGMLVGGLIIFVRMVIIACPTCCSNRTQAHVEMIVSVFLVFLFGAAVALITGIGGPGQSVGDLYYSTWLAFWVSLGIFVECYGQTKLEDKKDVVDMSPPMVCNEMPMKIDNAVFV